MACHEPESDKVRLLQPPLLRNLRKGGASWGYGGFRRLRRLSTRGDYVETYLSQVSQAISLPISAMDLKDFFVS